nr:hypothetical protein [Companilactobacillus huachuanensis]
MFLKESVEISITVKATPIREAAEKVHKIFIMFFKHPVMGAFLI